MKYRYQPSDIPLLKQKVDNTIDLQKKVEKDKNYTKEERELLGFLLKRLETETLNLLEQVTEVFAEDE